MSLDKSLLLPPEGQTMSNAIVGSSEIVIMTRTWHQVCKKRLGVQINKICNTEIKDQYETSKSKKANCMGHIKDIGRDSPAQSV